MACIKQAAIPPKVERNIIIIILRFSQKLSEVRRVSEVLSIEIEKNSTSTYCLE